MIYIYICIHIFWGEWWVKQWYAYACFWCIKRSKRDPPISPAWVRRVSFFGVKFRHRFWHAFLTHFVSFRLPFGLHFGIVFHNFGITFSSIVSASIFHEFGNGFWFHFWCSFDTRTVRTCNLLNHQKHVFLQSMVLPFRETWFLMIFMIFPVTCFCIDN